MRNEELVDACPHIACGDCKWFNVRADLDGVESTCKRLDHKHFQFAVPWFKSYDCGQFGGCVCKDFEPAPWFKYLYEHWISFDDYFGEDYAPTKLMSIVIDKNQKIRYLIRENEFIDGTFVDNKGELKWLEKAYYKIDRNSPIGYRLVHEKRKLTAKEILERK